MPSPLGVFPKSEDEGLNLRLWVAVLLPPIAGGVNVVVGYIVSNYACNVHNRHLVFLVDALCFAACGISARIASGTRRQIETKFDDPSTSLRATRLFLRKLALCLAAGFTLLTLAATFSTALLGACDL